MRDKDQHKVNSKSKKHSKRDSRRDNKKRKKKEKNESDPNESDDSNEADVFFDGSTEDVYLLEDPKSSGLETIEPTFFEIEKSLDDLGVSLLEANETFVNQVITDPAVKKGLNLLLTLNFRNVQKLKDGINDWIENQMLFSGWNCTTFLIDEQLQQSHRNILSWLLNPPSQVSYDQIKVAFHESRLQYHIDINLNRIRQNFEHLDQLPGRERVVARLNCGVYDYNIAISNSFCAQLNQEEIYLINWFFSKDSIVTLQTAINPRLEIRHTPFFYSNHLNIKSLVCFSFVNLGFSCLERLLKSLEKSFIILLEY